MPTLHTLGDFLQLDADGNGGVTMPTSKNVGRPRKTKRGRKSEKKETTTTTVDLLCTPDVKAVNQMIQTSKMTNKSPPTTYAKITSKSLSPTFTPDEETSIVEKKSPKNIANCLSPTFTPDEVTSNLESQGKQSTYADIAKKSLQKPSCASVFSSDDETLPKKPRSGKEGPKAIPYYQYQILLASQELTSQESQLSGDNVKGHDISIKKTNIWNGEETIVLSSQEKSDMTSTLSPATDNVIQLQVPYKNTANTGTNNETCAPLKNNSARITACKDKYNNFKCVSSGTINQNDLPTGGGNQCVVMSSSAFSYAALKKNNSNTDVLSSSEINQIIIDGNDNYLNLLGRQKPRVLDPEELPQVLQLCNYSIEVTKPEWIINGLYPKKLEELNVSVEKLSKTLCEIFSNPEYKTSRDGFLFTGGESTVSFWRKYEALKDNIADDPGNGVYYLFNSHPISENYKSGKCTGNFGAKLFKVMGTQTLASLLLNTALCFNREYSIHNIKLCNWQINGKSSNVTDNNTIHAAIRENTNATASAALQSSNTPNISNKDKYTNFVCISTGTMNQNDLPTGGGLQCVVMSSSAFCYAAMKINNSDTEHLTTTEIDQVLLDGNINYLNLLGRQKPRCIEPEELPQVLQLCNHSIKVTKPEWVKNGLYPKRIEELNSSVEKLSEKLCDIFSNPVFRTPRDGFLFTGGRSTVSFWRKYEAPKENIANDPKYGEYYLFNSHPIDENYKCEGITGNYGAKLFKAIGTQTLASLLLNTALRFNREYSIHNIKLINWQNIATTSNIHENVVRNNIQKNKDTCIDETKKKGRPKKIKRGRKTLNTTDIRIDDTLSEDSSQMNSSIDMFIHNRIDDVILNDNASTESIDIDASVVIVTKRGRPTKQTRGQKQQKENTHFEATSKYNKTHPEVNRRAVERYSETNPQVNQQAVRRYTLSHPEVNREAVNRYQENNPNRRQDSYITYNSVNRHVIPALRSGPLLIGERANDELNEIPLYSLKKSCLTAQNIFCCSHCGAKLFEEEKSRLQWCCGQGRNNVLPLPALDEQFYSERNFVKNARSYNNLFAFSAIGVSHGFQTHAQGISFVKIQGRVYHRVFDLSHRNDIGHNPIGLYIEDNVERERLAEERGLDPNIIRNVNDYLNRVNPFITCFKRLSEEASEEAHLIFENTTRRSHGNILGDMPRANEVAAIISTEREPYQPRSICIWKVGQSRPHTVDIFNSLYETFQYPLLYPHGGSGWTINTRENSVAARAPGKLSQVKYYRCLLLSENRFWQIGRLSEEWVVDMYCRVEEERLRYIANMQKRDTNVELRSAPLEEVRNAQSAIAGDETIQGEGGVVPGRIYLPNTFTGSPRFMKCKYMDSIAIVNRQGKPTYFLTMTCNPKWPEIQENTPPFCTPPAALCARVFQLKLNELLRDLRSGKWFGKLVYIFYVIEFQKRGLPHAHICFKVDHDLTSSNLEIDKFVQARIPDENEADGRLRSLVLKHMIHGPCGATHRRNLPCWDEDKERCSKRFPKPAAETTHIDDKGFVHLKRNEANTGTITYRSNEVTVNDRWVVPYNAALLLKYDCHINLDVAATRKVIKYLFKYMTKGPDEASVAIVPEELRNDEVEQYVVKRYIGACDAAWRMFEFDVTAREPTVKQLAVHLEGQQSVFFKPGNESDAIERSSSDLIKYFQRPIGAEFDELTYQDFYEQYIVESKVTNTNIPNYPINFGSHFVKKRQRGEMICRLFWVTPNRGEQFYLRMLLSVRPCRSYNDLIALGGPNCTTFQEAARAIGIANDEREYELCLQEAAAFYTGKRLRHFFVLLITNGAPALILWEQFKQALSEDILERISSQDPQRGYETALMEIDRLLRKYGSRLQDHGLPAVEDSTTELSRERLEYDSNRLVQFVEHWVPLLSQGQKQVFDYVCTLLNNNNSNNNEHQALFLDGPAGTGKTLLLNLLVAYVRGVLKGVAICTASSGIAAQNYEGGCTAHSMFRLPLDLVDDQGYWGLTNLSQRAELIRCASLIIYDEAPMAHKFLIHILDRSLQDLMGSSLLFGGKLIILAGDFRQIPPVVTTARCPNDTFLASLRSSPIWDSLKKFSLTEAQRTREDEGYSEFLLNLGSGLCESLTIGTGRDEVTLISLRDISFVTELADLISFVFPDDILQDPDSCAQRAILTTHNINMKQINRQILEKMDGEVIHCYSVDSVDPEHADDFHLSVDTLHRVEAKGVPDHDLQIKKGCVCIIIRNLSFVDRLVNGTKVIVVDVSPRLITVRKPSESETYLIPRITFKCPIEPSSPIEMCRKQFPLSLCSAITTHKSQGQTLDSRVGIDLRSDCFSHGQLYVALGRVRNKENIKVLVRRERVINGVPLANNVIIRNLIN